ncbi:putative zinc finger protein [Orchesella cincta]|uniref:Putative zinc finger protein n=1 Tax=Orchesella cincta TaxID=48709 RepID=A0A1D2MBG4_ORCCI|nr:putative zinc finger protein [Orchesella cincta]
MSREWEALKVTFAGIERQVADGELKRFRRVNSGMVSELEKEKAVLLRDMLLEGYRVKLLKSQRRPHPAVSNMVVGSDASSSSSSLIPEQSASLTSDSSWIEMEMDESDEAEESVDILVWDDEQPTLRDSETETSLTISNIRTVANKKEEVGLLQVKKEMIAEKGTENQSVSGDHEVFQLAPGTKRRRWYEGIEIFRIVGSGPDVANHQLQCGLCNFTVVDKKIRRAGQRSSGFKRMKDHIHVEHLGRTFEPPTAEKVKVQLNSFENDCDICGRKIKGPPCNLKRHKFLHKNDAERQAAVDAGERGDYVMLRLANKQKRTRKPLVFQSSRIRGRKQIYKCYACGKIFDQESEFKEHAKYHAVERASSMDASKSTAGHPSVRRSAVKYKVAK